MKKVLIISFLIFAILISFLGSTYAAITVTEETLENSFAKFIAESENNSDSTGMTDDLSTMSIDKDAKQITFTDGEYTYVINYDLSDKPTFTVDLSFTNEMSKEECETENSKPTILMITFMLVSDIAGIEFKDSMLYAFSKIFEVYSSDTTSSAEFTNAIDYAKSIYDNINETFTDDLFTWTHTKISETSDEYNVQSTIIINNDADFSIMNGYADKTFGGITNSITNSLQNYTSTLQQSVDNITETSNKLPQTGNFFDLKDALYLICITSSIVLIFIVFKSVKYRNIKTKLC